MIISEKLPVFFIPHGGGPWHIMDDFMGDPQGYGMLRNYLKKIGNDFHDKIKAILVVSGHWEESVPTINFSEHPTLLYDYYGFPEFTYQLNWPALGNLQLASRIESLLLEGGFTTARENLRGFDHGVFVPLMLAFPQADIPVVQLSLIKGLRPIQHIAMGKALESLRSEGVLIIGSGMSFHNLRGMMSGNQAISKISEQFDKWLNHAVENKNSEIRNQLLTQWLGAPGARESHPRSEHLAPLFVVAGAAGNDLGKQDFSGTLLNVKISSYRFG